MHSQSSLQTLRLSMTCDEWKLVDMALAAYAHNTVFRTVHEKLDAQVSTAKVLSHGRPLPAMTGMRTRS